MVKKNIVCIVQARMSSSRFPGKVLQKIHKEYTCLEFLIKRLRRSKKISRLVVACTKNSKDKKIIDILNKNKINYFRGLEKDVLNRYYQTAKKFNADIIIRITSDCPLMDPTLVDKFVLLFQKKNVDYLSNTSPRSFPDGLDIEIFNIKTLITTHLNAYTKYDREHVTNYMIKSKKFKKFNYKLNKNYSKLRITLDYKKDLIDIRNIIKRLKYKINFTWKDIIKVLGK
tara:strand:- start:39 stop:722 length:684 start_codon:yes stop_codon:yes gene_type:complete